MIPNHLSIYLQRKPLTFSGTDLAYRNFETPDIINRRWSGCVIVTKTQASQAQDHACIFRVMNQNNRLTLTVRTDGKINLRLYKADGTFQREIESGSIPVTGNTYIIGYSWTRNTMYLTIYDVTTQSLRWSGQSSTNISTLPAWTETDGVYIGNREDLSLPYSGKIYGGCFGMSEIYYHRDTMAAEFASGNTCLGRDFLLMPQIMGESKTNIIREPNGLDLTIVSNDLSSFWG